MKQYLRFFKPIAIRKGVLVPETAYAANTNLLKFVEDHYKCPQAELLAPKRPNLKLGKVFLKLTRRNYGEEGEEVPPGSFLTIIFSIQGSIHDITKYITLYAKFGPFLTLLLFWFIYIFIAMPLYMVFFFLSNYTRNSYMKIWLAVPILQGVSFSVAMLNFVSCILNMSLVTLHVLYIFGGFVDWLECGYQYDFGTKCIAALNASNFCPDANMAMPEVGTYVFLKHVVTSKFGDTINWYWIIIMLVAYILIIFGSLFSKFVLTPLCHLTSLTWVVIIIVVLLHEFIYGPRYTIIPTTSASFSTALLIPFWVASAKISLRRVMPGDLVTYGSITMAGMNPITMAVLLVLMRICFVTTVANFFVISLNRFVIHHGVRHSDCLEVNGLTILYCFIPDHLLEVDSSRFIFFAYHFLSTYMGSMSTFLSINGFLTSITSDYPASKDNKNTVLTIICIIMCLANIAIIGIGFEYILFEELKIYLAPFITYCCVAFFISSYSPLRITNDFYFAFGARLATFWSSLMKLYVIFVAVIVTFYVFFDMHNMAKNKAIGANIIALVLILTPIVLFAIIRVYMARNTKLSIMQPDTTWGSPNPKVRAARAAFNAKRECRITMELRCHHECLVDSKLNEGFLWDAKSKFKIAQRQYLKELITKDPTFEQYRGYL